MDWAHSAPTAVPASMPALKFGEKKYLKEEKNSKFFVNFNFDWYFVTKIVLTYCEKKMF
jgi:hypothetical protein